MTLRDRIKVHKNKVYAWVIGTGFILVGVHNPGQPFLSEAFIPLIGMSVSAFAMLFYLRDHRSEITLGPRKIWVPLIIIVAGMASSGVAEWARGNADLQQTIAPLVFGVILFGGYITARILKEDMIAPFAFMVVIESVSCVWAGLTHAGIRTGGIVGPTNYDMASGFLILGVLFSLKRHQWWLTAVALVGLAFAGAEEAMVAGAVLTLALVIRRDWSKKILLPVGVGVVGVILLLTTNIGTGLYDTAEKRINELVIMAQGGENDHGITRPFGEGSVEYPREFITVENENEFLIQYDYEWEETLDNIFWWRWTQYKHAFNQFSWFGNGYTITEFSLYTVHNVPFLIVDQVGPFASLAWLFVVGYCLIKTRWKYAWLAVISLSLFDHYLWTQVAPWVWVLVGVSTVSQRKNDLIFKGDNDESK